MPVMMINIYLKYRKEWICWWISEQSFSWASTRPWTSLFLNDFDGMHTTTVKRKNDTYLNYDLRSRHRHKCLTSSRLTNNVPARYALVDARTSPNGVHPAPPPLFVAQIWPLSAHVLPTHSLGRGADPQYCTHPCSIGRSTTGQHRTCLVRNIFIYKCL
jgi:hypothetical protein